MQGNNADLWNWKNDQQTLAEVITIRRTTTTTAI
jgi:hypothetical protein